MALISITTGGTEIPLTEDAHGWVARRDGVTYYLCAARTAFPDREERVTPAKWVARAKAADAARAIEAARAAGLAAGAFHA